MTVFNAQPLFYAAALARADLVALVEGAALPPAIDTIDFDDEAGGDADRALALPFLPGMDALELTDASLTFRVGARQVEIPGYAVSAGPGGQGIVLKLDTPARIAKLELSYVVDPKAHLIVRPVLGADFGPPILAAPDFPPPGPTYGRTLTGMSVADSPGNRHVVTLPHLQGTAWLLQLATGDDPAGLSPMPVAITVNRVVIDAAPRNLSIVLGGDPPVTLWSNKETLLSDAGEQTATFLPIAHAQLTKALAKADPASLTLPLSLRFHSDTSARIEVTGRALAGRYTLRPLEADPVTLRLGGDFAPLALRTPAGLTPSATTATLTARLLGRALNAGSAPAPLALPGRGLRAATDRIVAARLPIAARSAFDAAGTPVPLASVSLRLAPDETAEAVVELRRDAAGVPAAAAAPAVVRQIPAGFAGWLEFPLAAPLMAAAGETLWVALRLTKGALLWHGAPAGGGPAGLGEARISIDKGASWGSAAAALAPPIPLLVQGFHVQDPPYPQPVIRLQSGSAPLTDQWFAAAVRTSEREFQSLGASLPAGVLALLAGAPGAPIELLVSSDTVLDLVVAGLALSYDPFAARAGG